MRKKGCYHKNRPFRLLVAAALRFVQSYLNDIDSMGSISNGGVLYERRKHIAEGTIPARGRTEAPAQGAGRKAAGRRSDPHQMERETALLG